MLCLCCPATLRDIFHTPVAQYSLFVLKVQLTNFSNTVLCAVLYIATACVYVCVPLCGSVVAVCVIALLTLTICVSVFQPNTEGFLVMLLPRKQEHKAEMQRLSTAEDYRQLLMSRQMTTS